MKKYVKGRCFPLLVAFFILAVTAFIMALFGWRITYAPELDNSWDAISAVAAWGGVFTGIVGVVASFVAIWFAIQVPKEIAVEQNKIALFEKRYEAYASILIIEAFASALDQEMFEDNKKDINGRVLTLEAKVGLYCLNFATIFGFPPNLNKGDIDIASLTQTLAVLKNHEMKAKMLPVLFCAADNQFEKMTAMLSDIFDPLRSFMSQVATYRFDEQDCVSDKSRKKFIVAAKKFKREYLTEIEKEMSIRTR